MFRQGAFGEVRVLESFLGGDSFQGVVREKAREKVETVSCDVAEGLTESGVPGTRRSD